jgi:histidine ammonia-lyase
MREVMSDPLLIRESVVPLSTITDYVFGRRPFSGVALSEACLTRVRQSYGKLQEKVEGPEPIYGVTTGFGDNCDHRIPPAQSEILQKNLVSYLLCGTGPALAREAVRATALVRLISLSRGFSGVSEGLIDHLQRLVTRDWLPRIPREGSLGASGDLIPLAYLARAVQGQGDVETPEGKVSLSSLLRREGIEPYVLKPKEGLALVNGTSVMAGLGLVNWNSARFLLETSVVATGWLCLGLEGHTDPFGELVNLRAKSFPGQTQAAKQIRSILEAEDYVTPVRHVSERIQDRYSLRCAPQILGPIYDTLQLLEHWLEWEINSVSDNPLIAYDGEFAMGGNFYGGYLSHGMDYLKICIGHLADLTDRQLTLIIDDTTSRGLPPNLSDWGSIPESERFLHHGLKGLHQSVSAVTSEILARTLSNGIFSRSSESHNQDKVSLGMSAAVAASEILDTFFRVQAMQLICLAQAVDLRKHKLKGAVSVQLYDTIRAAVPFVTRDIALDEGIDALTQSLHDLAKQRGKWFLT